MTLSEQPGQLGYRQSNFRTVRQFRAPAPLSEDHRELVCSTHFRQLEIVLADEKPSPEQIEAYRRMTPERRLALAEELYWSAREWKASGLRAQHPHWSADQVASEVTRLFLHART